MNQGNKTLRKVRRMSDEKRKETESSELKLPDGYGQEEKQEDQRVVKKASRAVFLLVALLFAGVMFLTYFFELKFGKTVGTIVLIIAAFLIAGYLYRKELMEKLKRKK